MEHHIKTKSWNPVEITATVQYTDPLPGSLTGFVMAKEWRVNLFGVVGTGPNFLDAMADLQNRLSINEGAILKLESKVYDTEPALGTAEETTEEEAIELNEKVDKVNTEEEQEYPLESV